MKGWERLAGHTPSISFNRRAVLAAWHCYRRGGKGTDDEDRNNSSVALIERPWLPERDEVVR